MAYISDTAQQQSFEVLPAELMIWLIEQIPPFDWPDYWNLGLTCYQWQNEVKNLFRKKYLPNLIIETARLPAHHRPPLDGYTFEIAEVTDDRAVLKPRTRIYSEIDWETVVLALRQGDMREYQLYAITLPDVYIVNNTELVGLQEDYRAHTISIEWFPTLSALFREERQLRKLFRIDAEYVTRDICVAGWTNITAFASLR
ncbi:hypothetical protein F5Y07DRAFT_396816 [Xylaria sp. FL0933]|nr:hypothetical protein F5Y07DRAFT_396816 [Xylaria sp. FL0933]